MRSGKSKKALETLKKAEDAAMKAKEGDLLLYVQTVKGHLMQNLGEYEEALKIHIITLKILEEILSKDHCDEIYLPILQMNLKYIFELGNIFYNMGRFLEAKSCYEMNLVVLYKLIKIYPENLAYQSYVAGTFNNLGALLADMGRIEEAKDVQKNRS